MNANKEQLASIAAQYGTPAFVYHMDHVYGRIDALRSAFEGVMGVSYAMKCNPHPGILRRLMNRVDTLDISSGGELRAAMKLAWPAERISFTGPGKQTWEWELAVRYGIGEVIVESVREAVALSEIAGKAGKRQGILVRIAPSRVPKGFGSHMAGKASQFGVDEELAEGALAQILALPHLRLRGLHIYSGTQCLKSDAIAENYGIFCEIFRALCTRFDVVPEKLVFGSGIGIPYHDGDQSVDARAIAQHALPALREFKREARFKEAHCLLETGRYLVGEAGLFVTRVVHRKVSRGSSICVCDGGMNHHLGAAGHLGMVIHKHYRLFKVVGADGAEQPIDLYGPLCTSIDHLGKNVKIPGGLEVGDVIAIHCSGAYGLTSSPVNFISHDVAREIFVESRGGQCVVTDESRLTSGPAYAE